MNSQFAAGRAWCSLTTGIAAGLMTSIKEDICCMQ